MNHHQNLSQQIKQIHSIEHKILGVARVLLGNQGVLLAAGNTGVTTLELKASINFHVAGAAMVLRTVRIAMAIAAFSGE
ncbi:MAG: hypothetical protein F6K22_29160 [Okeania sp. SIO2F4]|uniref:hypothetical protein n=1 Tax=Okeania sp. SIO2F4 TaxID=2607790 RepID=UPI00142B257A|nr:hypothetical protein [Okeania sp. SIO2F4]NES06529.1 hypothetical protein [Okeania sp. SIO2F4]